MKKNRTKYLLMAGLIACFMLPYSLHAETKTMTRTDDPAVIECKDMKPLFGKAMDQLAMMARNGDDWAPIPFQIDQKNPAGDYCFTMGPAASKDPDPNLDANDELVFMVKDTGDRVEDGNWPEGAGAGVEVLVTDPKNGNKGWAYLLGFSGKAPRSKDDYIKLEIDKGKNRRRVITYEYIMGGPLDRVYPDEISAAILPDGSRGKDVLDMLKMRGEFVLPLGIAIDFHLDDWTKSTDKGYIDGPVRVLHLSEGYMELASYLKLKGEGYSTTSYYVNHMVWPWYMDMPIGALAKAGIIKELKFYGYMDFNENVYGSCSFSAANPYNKDVILDGKMSEAEKNLDRQTPIDWIAGFGPQGAIISRLNFKPQKDVVQLPYYIDDATLLDPPEEHPGVTGVGYKLEGLDSTKDTDVIATIYQYYYYKSQLKPEEVHLILDILDHPVKISAKAIGSLN